jgi:hypothetical protein
MNADKDKLLNAARTRKIKWLDRARKVSRCRSALQEWQDSSANRTAIDIAS